MGRQGDDPWNLAGLLNQRSPAMRSETNVSSSEGQALNEQGKTLPCDRLPPLRAKGSAMIPKHPEALR
ncbi:hypothetical protein DAEQUDRAFT_733544, partial [Daedalea quercina L-15889]